MSLQNEQSKRYLGGAEENVTCFAQAATETEKWTLHLAVHPNVAMYNPNRKRYVRCDDKTGVLRCDRDMPWGAESVITIYYDFRGGWWHFPILFSIDMCIFLSNTVTHISPPPLLGERVKEAKHSAVGLHTHTLLHTLTVIPVADEDL